MARYEINECDLCGVKIIKGQELDKSGKTTSSVSFWKHVERKGHATLDGTHYKEICPKCTEEIAVTVGRLGDQTRTTRRPGAQTLKS